MRLELCVYVCFPMLIAEKKKRVKWSEGLPATPLGSVHEKVRGEVRMPVIQIVLEYLAMPEKHWRQLGREILSISERWHFPVPVESIQSLWGRESSRNMRLIRSQGWWRWVNSGFHQRGSIDAELKEREMQENDRRRETRENDRRRAAVKRAMAELDTRNAKRQRMTTEVDTDVDMSSTRDKT